MKSIDSFFKFSRQRENRGKYSAKVWTIVDIEKLCKSLESLKCHLKEGDSVKVLNFLNKVIFKDIYIDHHHHLTSVLVSDTSIM